MNTKKVMEYFSDFRKKYNTTYVPVAEFLLQENEDGLGPSFNDLLEALDEGGELDAAAGNMEAFGVPYASNDSELGREDQATARVMTVLLGMAAELSNLDVLATYEEQGNRQ
jgi:hypothetical protein